MHACGLDTGFYVGIQEALPLFRPKYCAGGTPAVDEQHRYRSAAFTPLSINQYYTMPASLPGISHPVFMIFTFTSRQPHGPSSHHHHRPTNPSSSTSAIHDQAPFFYYCTNTSAFSMSQGLRASELSDRPFHTVIQLLLLLLAPSSVRMTGEVGTCRGGNTAIWVGFPN